MESVSSQSQTPKRAYWLVALAMLAGVAALIVPIFYLIASALMAYAAARTRPASLIVATAAILAGAFMLYTPVEAAFLGGMIALGGVALYLLQTKRFGNANTGLCLAGVFMLGLYGALCLPSVLAGEGAFTLLENATSAYIESYRAALTGAPGVDAAMLSYMNELLDAFAETVPTMIVSVLCAIAAALGLSNLLLFRLFCRKHPETGLDRMRPFRSWSLPRSLILGLIGLLVASLILEMSEWAYAAAFSNTVSTLLAIPLSLQGLCVVDFVIDRRARKKTTTRVLVYTAIGALFAFAQMPLSLIGSVEYVFHFRARLDGAPPMTHV